MGFVGNRMDVGKGRYSDGRQPHPRAIDQRGWKQIEIDAPCADAFASRVCIPSDCEAISMTGVKVTAVKLNPGSRPARMRRVL